MKAFFEQCLRDLHRLTGLKQYMEICNKPTEAEAKEEMDIIVAGMVRVSDKFNYIPNDAQKRIVTHQIVSDAEMYALNAKIVYKWFNAVSDKYWHESGHLETNALREGQKENAEPISEKTQAMINRFMAELAGGTIQSVPKVSVLEMEKIKSEDEIKQGRSKSKGIAFTPEQELIRHELHLQWISENYDIITGKPLPNYQDEKTWLNQVKKEG